MFIFKETMPSSCPETEEATVTACLFCPLSCLPVFMPCSRGEHTAKSPGRFCLSRQVVCVVRPVCLSLDVCRPPPSTAECQRDPLLPHEGQNGKIGGELMGKSLKECKQAGL